MFQESVAVCGGVLQQTPTHFAHKCRLAAHIGRGNDSVGYFKDAVRHISIQDGEEP